MSTLTTSRLMLRPLLESDLRVLAAAINNPSISQYLARVPWPYDLDDAQAFFDYTRNLPPRSAIFALVPRGGDEPLVGMISYETSTLETELGYWLSEDRWGCGLMREAAHAVVEHAFAVSGLERLQSRCFIGNEASRRLLVALGFRPVGIGRVFAPVPGKPVATHEFELSATEWRLLHPNSRRSKTLAP